MLFPTSYSFSAKRERLQSYLCHFTQNIKIVASLLTYRKRKSKSQKNVKINQIFLSKRLVIHSIIDEPYGKTETPKEKLNFTRWGVVAANRPKMKTWNSIQILVWFKSIILIRLFIIFTWLNKKFKQVESKIHPGEYYVSKVQLFWEGHENLELPPA